MPSDALIKTMLYFTSDLRAISCLYMLLYVSSGNVFSHKVDIKEGHNIYILPMKH